MPDGSPGPTAELLLSGPYRAGGFGLSIVGGGNLQARILAIVNFAGGIGGKNDASRATVQSQGRRGVLGMVAAARKRPTSSIWIYSENGSSSGVRAGNPSAKLADCVAYVGAGGRAELHMPPPIGQDGHDIVDPGVTLWRPHLDRFLTTLGLDPRKPPPGSPPPSSFAGLEDVRMRCRS